MLNLDRDTLSEALLTLDWEQDRFGHFKKVLYPRNRQTGELVRKVYRIKMQATSVRIEVQLRVGDANEWYRVGGAYYTKIFKRDNGEVVIGSMILRKEVQS